MKNKVLLLGLFFLSAGVVFLRVESEFYQYVDAEGFLRESLFLPMGIFSLIIGFLLLFIFIVKKLM